MILRRVAVALGAVILGLTTLAPVQARGTQYYSGPGYQRPYHPIYRAPAPVYTAPAPVYRSAPAPVYRSVPVAPSAGGSATDAIAQAASRWGVDYNWLLRVASCESGLNPGAQNPSGASGLFQFMPGTYWLYAGRIGETRSYWDPYGAANVAGYMFANGMSGQWTCR